MLTLLHEKTVGFTGYDLVSYYIVCVFFLSFVGCMHSLRNLRLFCCFFKILFYIVWPVHTNAFSKTSVFQNLQVKRSASILATEKGDLKIHFCYHVMPRRFIFPNVHASIAAAAAAAATAKLLVR